MKVKKCSVHLLYIIGILAFLLIMNITFKYGQDNVLVSYISFAAALISIILALIAIFQAFFSGSQISKSLYKIQDASTAIENTSKSLDGNAQLLKEKIEEIPNSLKSITDALTKNILLIQDKIGEIPPSISSVNKSLDLLLSQGSSATGSSVASLSAKYQWTKENVTSLWIELGSVINLVLFALIKSEENSEEKSVTDILHELNLESADNFIGLGVLWVFVAMGLVRKEWKNDLLYIYPSNQFINSEDILKYIQNLQTKNQIDAFAMLKAKYKL